MTSEAESKASAVFFHGLNTFKDDLLHLGPVTLGRMDRHLSPALQARGVHVYSIDGIGFGSPEEQARTACSQIVANAGITHGSRLSFLGNSMGGLVARALANLWKSEPATNPKNLKVERLISWGTPHRGTRVAEFAADFSLLGRKINASYETFRHYSPSALAKFNERHPLNSVAPEYFFECAGGLDAISPYFWALRWMDPEIQASPSDGFILGESQRWGECRGHFALDHFGQMGFSTLLAFQSQREKSRNEFNRLCEDLAQLVLEPC